MKVASSLVLLVLTTALGAPACRSGPDHDSYVKANKSLFRHLPVFPGASPGAEVSTPVRAEEDRPVIGYVTRFEVRLPPRATADDVASFFRRRLEPKWRLVENLGGRVLNFRNGRASVSINLESWRTHVLEVAVDHRH